MSAISFQQDQLVRNAAPNRNAAAKPRIAFVGVGWIGRSRLEAIASAEMAEIVCIADPNETAAIECCSCAPNAKIVSNFDDALASEPDGIVIATPSALHAEQSIAALERGIAVFCQKPLGRTAAETRRVIDSARTADRLLGVDLSYRFVKAAAELRNLIQCGELGDIFAVDLVFHNAYGPDKPWFYDAKLSGGGCVIDLGIHLADLALWTLGFPHVTKVDGQLFAKGTPLEPNSQQVEDFANASITLESGVAMRLACSWNLPAGRDAIIEANFYGTRGGAALRNVNGSFYDFVALQFDGTKSRTLVDGPDAWSGCAAMKWMQRLASGAKFDPEIERLVAVASVLDRIYGRTP